MVTSSGVSCKIKSSTYHITPPQEAHFRWDFRLWIFPNIAEVPVFIPFEKSELGKRSQLLFSPLSVKEQYTNGSTFSFWPTRSSIMLLVTLQCFQALPITDIPTGECALVCFLFPFPCRYDSHWKLLWPFLPFYLEHTFKSTLEEVSQVTVNHFQVSSTSGRYKKFISLTLLAKQAFLLISPCHPNNRWQSAVLC